MSAVTQINRDIEDREHVTPDANRRAYMAKRRRDWEARSRLDRGMSGPPTRSAKLSAAPAAAPEPQREYKREMREASCIANDIPLGFTYPQRPQKGPTVAEYYERKRKGNSP